MLKSQLTSPNYMLFMREVLRVSLIRCNSRRVLLNCLPTAYDLKLVIDKGVVDVLKPSWITASIELGETLPLRKK